MYGNPFEAPLTSRTHPTLDPSVEKPRQMEIESELGKLEKSTSTLETRIQKLYERLSPVMSSQQSGQDSAELPDASLCQLAESIRRQDKIVRLADAAVAEILHRLEL